MEKFLSNISFGQLGILPDGSFVVLIFLTPSLIAD